MATMVLLQRLSVLISLCGASSLHPSPSVRSWFSSLKIAAPSPTYSRTYTLWTDPSFPATMPPSWTSKGTPSPASPSKTEPESGVGSSSHQLTYRQVFERLGVRPPWQVPPRVWRWCYHVHRFLLRFVLHAGDPLVVPNSSLSGLILWWKALVGNDHKSPAYDQGWAGDLLPPATGWIAGRPTSSKFPAPSLRRFFPRLNHANIEVRTVYLNEAIDRVLQAWKRQKPDSSTSQARKVRVVVLGAGYDLRGTRLLTEGVVQDVLELDLPEVIEAKQALWTRRLKRRRPNVLIPRLVPADLNDVNSTRALLLEQLLSDEDSSERREWSTIFVLEGILVHLKTEAGHELLKVMSSLTTPSETTALIFADALPYVTQRRLEEAQAELQKQGWTLLEFIANPTKAPHMGIAIKS
jgi:Leucine carboxyl methyltransferase